MNITIPILVNKKAWSKLKSEFNKEGKKKLHLSLRVSYETKQQLELKAQELKYETVSQLVRKIIKEYLESKK
jgi:hypothetical protein